MPKLTYLLIQSARGSYPSPIAVCGSGVLGHALYDPAHGAHVFRFTQEEWEGGIDRQIAENKHRSFGKWIVRAEVEPDLESPAGKHAQEVDALKAEIAELNRVLDDNRRDAHEPARDSASDPLQSLPPPADGPPSVFTAPPTVPSPDLSEMGFDDLDALFDKLNADGAGMPEPEGKRSKVKLRDLLNAHYAKAT